MPKVNIVYFNPMRQVKRGFIARFIPIKRPLNNFGDLLGPIIVDRLLKSRGLSIEAEALRPDRLLAVGSILHLAKSGDVIWGSGRNGKISEENHFFKMLDVRSVRGPLTRDFLTKKDIFVPEIYGDPALLLPRFMPELKQLSKKKYYDITYMPNFNDYDKINNKKGWLFNPRAPLNKCLKRIAHSRMVIGSSLHAIVVAEALGIPARAVQSNVEPEFKYADYYLGTGRNDFRIAGTPEEAVSMGGEKPARFSAESLIQSFPWDLWESKANYTIKSLSLIYL